MNEHARLFAANIILAILVLAGCGGGGGSTPPPPPASFSLTRGTADQVVSPKSGLSNAGEEIALGVAGDASGNVYVVGYTSGDLFETTTTPGVNDAFIRKYGADGSIDNNWELQLFTDYDDQARAVAVDNSGSVFIVGASKGDFSSANEDSSYGTFDVFVNKYDSGGGGGIPEWEHQFGSSGQAADDFANAVCLDRSGNAYVVGYTNGDLFGTNQGNKDIFIRKYLAGNAVDVDPAWDNQIGTIGNEDAKGCAVDGGGNVYVVGYTYGDLLGEISMGGRDAFIIRFGNDGVVEKTKLLGTSLLDSATGVAADGSGYIYVSGYTYMGDFDNTRTNPGKTDYFLAKLDNELNTVWIRQYGTDDTANSDTAVAVAVDSNGYVHVLGQTNGDLFDTNVNPGGLTNDYFLAVYDASGNLKWSDQFGTDAGDSPQAIFVDGSGKVFIAGGVTNGWFDPNSSNISSSDGTRDIFVIKYTP